VIKEVESLENDESGEMVIEIIFHTTIVVFVCLLLLFIFFIRLLT